MIQDIDFTVVIAFQVSESQLQSEFSSQLLSIVYLAVTFSADLHSHGGESAKVR